MKSITELERDIASIILKIYNEFPELFKHIGELPNNYAGNESNQIGLKKFEEYYNSLSVVLSDYDKTIEATIENIDSESLKFKGYPHYPPSDDIYNQEIQETELNPEELSKNKTPNEETGKSNERLFNENMSGDDLDVPGSELDDQQESVGSEDEENNYYSLGGDNHDN
ncbi:MAG: hypothetical protein ACK4RM_08925 [Flavobacterium sp.]